VPASVEKMAANAAAFIKALGLAKVDVLGFSLGGLVAQEIALAEPKLVRRLILLGTVLGSKDVLLGPRGLQTHRWREPDSNPRSRLRWVR
jgi:pimeloyl-ACP methyl ester carboxylesterase